MVAYRQQIGAEHCRREVDSCSKDYRQLPLSQIEGIEKETLRLIVQALQEYSREAKDIFENAETPSDSEIVVLAEDIVQYALEVAECYPINKRFQGFYDYKRVRWLPTPFGIFPQALLVDAKASTENNRTTLQRSQLPMDAVFMSNNLPVELSSGVDPHLEIRTAQGEVILAITTCVLVHFYYQKIDSDIAPYRELKSLFAVAVPHAVLKEKYNPNAQTSFFGQGKHAPSRGEDPRIRIYFDRLKNMCPWRLQELRYQSGHAYTIPIWHDSDAKGSINVPFQFIGR